MKITKTHTGTRISTKFAIRVGSGQYLHRNGRPVFTTSEISARKIAHAEGDAISIVVLSLTARGFWFASSEIELLTAVERSARWRAAARS